MDGILGCVREDMDCFSLVVYGLDDLLLLVLEGFVKLFVVQRSCKHLAGTWSHDIGGSKKTVGVLDEYVLIVGFSIQADYIEICYVPSM